MTIDIASLVASNQSNDTNLRGAMAGVTDLFQQIVGVAEQRTGLLQQGAVDQALVTTAADTATMAQQQRTLASATELGTNRDANTQALSGLIAQINGSFAEAQNQRAVIAEKQSRKILDDPLGWLEGQLTVNDNVAAYNNSAANYSANVTQLSVINDLTQEIAATDIAIKAGMTAGTIAANSRLQSAVWQDKAAASTIEAIKTNADGLLQAANMSDKLFNNQLRLRDQAMQEKSFALAQENARLARDERAERVAAKNAGEAEKQDYVDSVNAYRQNIGAAPITAVGLSNLMRSPEQKAILDDQYVTGATIRQTGKRAIAADPVTAIQQVQQSNGQLDGGRKVILDWAGTQVNAVQEAARAAGKPIKTIGELKEQATAFTTGLAKSQAANINTGDPSKNIYAPPSLGTLLSDPEISKLPGVQTLLKPMFDSGVKTFEPKTIIPLITANIGKDGLTQAGAIATITALANKSIAINNATFDYKSTIGIPNQEAFKVTLPNPMKLDLGYAAYTPVGVLQATGNFGASLVGKGTPITKSYDLSNPNDVAAYVNASQASLLVKAFGGKR